MCSLFFLLSTCSVEVYIPSYYSYYIHVCISMIVYVMGTPVIIFNPRRACAARVTVVCWPNSCMCVCLSVTTLAKASLGYTPR